MPEPTEKATLPRAAQVTRAQLRRILVVTERQLSAWERQGWLPLSATPPAARTHSRPAVARTVRRDAERRYSFADVAALRMVLRLRQSGVSAARLRSLQSAIQKNLLPPETAGGWNGLQVQSHGKRLSVSFQGARMEPLTGQFILDFEGSQRRPNVQSLPSSRRHLELSEPERRARADRFFLAGLRYEERVETLPKAVRAYQKATELNPRALGAFINLGTIYYHQGLLDDAERCYHAALSLHPHSALVYFNLGNLVEERGQWEKAQEHYEQAIRLDPVYPDPRFNLALVYERLGRHGRAAQQWRGYLKLDSTSRWAVYARQKLEQISLHLVSPVKTTPQHP